MTNKQNQTKLKDYITHIAKSKTPATTDELIQLVQKKYLLSQEELADIICQIETEHKTSLTKTPKTQLIAKKTYFPLKNTIWFWLTIGITITATVAVFIIPKDVYPLVYLRQGVGLIFVMLLPGYAFIKVLYPKKLPIVTSTENLDTIERITLSIGLSIALVTIVGIILNYTPWGLSLTSIALSLFIFTVLLALIGAFREYPRDISHSAL
ncbi:MAG: DUF1616 domain-containing protein [Nitrososphaerota archaeon]|jgi:hypothetical protein|nr:DUF1616 domain-containing protein [Nitrososphaerota archaeon]